MRYLVTVEDMKNKITFTQIQSTFFYFFIYSLIGWFIETIYIFINQGRFVVRGIGALPACPVYGFGALIVILFLYPLKDHILLLFLSSTFFTTGLEYITGFILINFFNKKLWNYGNEFLNVNGIICLKISLCWGVMSVLLLYVLHPFIQQVVACIPAAHKIKLAYFMVFFLMVGITNSIYSTLGQNPQVEILNWLSSTKAKIQYLSNTF